MSARIVSQLYGPCLLTLMTLFLALPGCRNGTDRKEESEPRSSSERSSSTSSKEKEEGQDRVQAQGSQGEQTKKKADPKEGTKEARKGDEEEEKGTSVPSRPTTRTMAKKGPKGPAGGLNPTPGSRDFRKEVAKNSQNYQVPATQDTMIRCEEGTELHFPAHAFENMNGAAIEEGKVNIEVKEYYENADILLAGLGTKSGDQLLETGGMVHLEAEADGQECQLREDKKMKIGFPRKEGQKDMKLFAGERNEEDRMNWEVESEMDLNRSYSRDEVDQEAIFPGGAASKAGYIREKMEYPAQAQVRGKEGVVRIGAEVARDGKLVQLKLLDSVSPSLNMEAMRMARNMPRWIPAKRNGQAVRSETRIDIRFRLGEELKDAPSRGKMDTVDEFEKKMEEKGSLKESNAREISNYLFQSSRLRGWHNCDRLRDQLDFKEYTVKLERSGDAEVKLFFPEGNSFMNASGRRKRYHFDQVPRNATVQVVAVRSMDNGYGLAIKKTNSRNEDPDLNFEKVSMDELKEEMQALNEAQEG